MAHPRNTNLVTVVIEGIPYEHAFATLEQCINRGLRVIAMAQGETVQLSNGWNYVVVHYWGGKPRAETAEGLPILLDKIVLTEYLSRPDEL